MREGLKAEESKKVDTRKNVKRREREKVKLYSCNRSWRPIGL
jgi:hypothetical protein